MFLFVYFIIVLVLSVPAACIYIKRKYTSTEFRQYETQIYNITFANKTSTLIFMDVYLRSPRDPQNQEIRFIQLSPNTEVRRDYVDSCVFRLDVYEDYMKTKLLTRWQGQSNGCHELFTITNMKNWQVIATK